MTGDRKGMASMVCAKDSITAPTECNVLHIIGSTNGTTRLCDVTEASLCKQLKVIMGRPRIDPDSIRLDSQLGG
ncbi:Hypothetical predicted protein [Scomber scombrus]|uniref:Uncharacterized protein n=1 Tax=Scomber scombrus TaxID=13677 RepID=A0AAV1PQ91_SCOSC